MGGLKNKERKLQRSVAMQYDINRIYDFPIDKIFADEGFNCRGHINPNDVSDLANDISNRGMDIPITVEPYDKDGFDFRILAGHRRHKAHQVIQSSGEKVPNSPDGTIRCVVREDLDQLGKLALNFNENTQRQNLNLKQESNAISKFVNQGLSRNGIADLIGMSGGWVQVRMYFGYFPERVQDILVAMNVKQAEVREFYKTLQDCDGGDLNPFLEQVKRYRETGSLKEGKSKKRLKDEKRQRNKAEINTMMKHIRENGMGSGILTRLLAWATGEVSEGEIDKELEDFHDDYGFDYERIHDDGS